MSDYLLGHDDREWDRLREQHEVWGPALMAELERAGLARGHRVLEVGCGAGDLLADLADLTGHARGLERDPAAAARARHVLEDRAVVDEGDLLFVELAPEHRWDAIVARWVLSFLPDPARVVARLAGALAPGGMLAIHDYNHDAMGIFPKHDAIDRVIDAYRSAFRDNGGDLWVSTRLPGAYRAAGLDDIEVAAHAKSGQPGSPVWRWVERFLHEHLDTIVDSGHISAADRAAFEGAWADRAADPDAVLFTPLQVTVIGRAPAADAADP